MADATIPIAPEKSHVDFKTDLAAVRNPDKRGAWHRENSERGQNADRPVCAFYQPACPGDTSCKSGMAGNIARHARGGIFN